MIEQWTNRHQVAAASAGLVLGILLGSWLGWPLSPKTPYVNANLSRTEIVHDERTRTIERVQAAPEDRKHIPREAPGKVQRVAVVQLRPESMDPITAKVAVSDAGDGLGRVTVQAEGATVEGGRDLVFTLPRRDYRHEISMMAKASRDGIMPGIGYAHGRGRVVFRGEVFMQPGTWRPREIAVGVGIRW